LRIADLRHFIITWPELIPDLFSVDCLTVAALVRPALWACQPRAPGSHWRTPPPWWPSSQVTLGSCLSSLGRADPACLYPPGLCLSWASWTRSRCRRWTRWWPRPLFRCWGKFLGCFPVTSSVGGRLAVEPSQPRGPGIEKDIFFKLCVFTNLKKSQHFNILFRPMFRKLTLTSRLVLHTMQCNVMWWEFLLCFKPFLKTTFKKTSKMV
jgi:hypothetical protein